MSGFIPSLSILKRTSRELQKYLRARLGSSRLVRVRDEDRNYYRLFLLAALVRIRRAYDGVLFLCKEELSTEALILSRFILEARCLMEWVSENPQENTARFFDQSFIFKQRLMEEVLKGKRPLALNPGKPKEIKAKADEARKKYGKEEIVPRWSDLADKLGLKSIYMADSAVLHLTPYGLESLLKQRGPNEFHFDDEQAKTQALMGSMTNLFGALKVFNSEFKVLDEVQLDGWEEKISQKSKATAARR